MTRQIDWVYPVFWTRSTNNPPTPNSFGFIFENKGWVVFVFF